MPLTPSSSAFSKSRREEVYDSLGVERVNADRIKNIAVLGVNTFGWTHITNKLPVPENVPYVKLTAPSAFTRSTPRLS